MENVYTAAGRNARRFPEPWGSARVSQNVSTRFADGGESGFGTEIGISSDKLHTRSPIGLREFTSYPYRVHGGGQMRRERQTS